MSEVQVKSKQEAEAALKLWLQCRGYHKSWIEFHIRVRTTFWTRLTVYSFDLIEPYGRFEVYEDGILKVVYARDSRFKK